MADSNNDLSDEDYPYEIEGVVQPLPIDARTRMRMLTLLESFPWTAARIELETLIRGGIVTPPSR